MGKVSRRDVKAGATTLLVGQVVQVIIAFAANLVLVRYIAPEGFGRFAITLATASLIVSLLSVRRHINWNNLRPDLKEDLVHLVQDIKRRICGIASAGIPSFSV